jgi:hypothetical protein
MKSPKANDLPTHCMDDILNHYPIQEQLQWLKGQEAAWMLKEYME